MALAEDEELKRLVLKVALLNAIQHGGKAQASALTGKIIGEKQELRTRAKELAALINEIVNEVNDLSIEEQKNAVLQEWPESFKKEKTEEEKHLPALPNDDKYAAIVTRFSPNPDCVLHLGSARAIILSNEYARMYNGKFILRFEDTDPKVKKPVLEFYDRIREDLTWLGCKTDEEYIQSDRLHIYYQYTDRLLQDGNAYVCTCSPDQFRKRTLERKPCDCRDLPPKQQMRRWRGMLEGSYGEGEAVVRVKTDLEHPNPAVRDWPALRIIDTKKYPHPRVGDKYRVWPLYNLAAGLDDHLMGITHVIRGKEHLTNKVRQEYMYNHLGWKYPEAIHYGRLQIKGASLSKSKIVQGIKEGIYKGWDDPRLATFLALRKRGITPEATKKMIVDVGPKPQDVTLSWENLYAYNRKILDQLSERYFFVSDPVKLKVDGIPREFKARLPKHPERREKGYRQYTILPQGAKKTATFWIAKKDAEIVESGTAIRFMELFNVEAKKTESGVVASFINESYEEARRTKAKLIHWIPESEGVPCRIFMPDGSIHEGLAESHCKKLKPNTVVQFERFGFVRLDQVGTKIVAYYGHK